MRSKHMYTTASFVGAQHFQAPLQGLSILQAPHSKAVEAAKLFSISHIVCFRFTYPCPAPLPACAPSATSADYMPGSLSEDRLLKASFTFSGKSTHLRPLAKGLSCFLWQRDSLTFSGKGPLLFSLAKAARSKVFWWCRTRT